MAMDNNQWLEFSELLERLKVLAPRARETVLRALRRKGLNPEILSLVELRLRDLSDGETVSEQTAEVRRLLGSLPDIDISGTEFFPDFNLEAVLQLLDSF